MNGFTHQQRFLFAFAPLHRSCGEVSTSPNLSSSESMIQSYLGASYTFAQAIYIISNN